MTLEPSPHRRMRELGERKEFLSRAEHEELLALVNFAHKRTIEKLEAQAALDRLRTASLAYCRMHERNFHRAPGHGGQTRWQPV